MIKYILILTLLTFTSTLAESPFVGEDHEPGLMTLSNDDEMFYWLVRSRGNQTEDPLVLWLTGGPGVAAQLSIISGIGPWLIDYDLNLRRNEESWNNVANILYVDQPIGTGFSRAGHEENKPKNEVDVANTMYDFLVKFVEKYPEFKGRKFFVGGVSYAGHFVPAITAHVVEQENPDLNLVASYIGNGWTNPEVQYPIYPEYLYQNGLISLASKYLYSGAFLICQSLIKLDFKMAAFKV